MLLCEKLTEWVGSRHSHVPGHTSLAIGVRHEPTVHAPSHRLTGLGERRLCGGVVLLHEFEDDHVADCGGDGFGVVAEDGRHTGCYGLEATNDDLMMLVKVPRHQTSCSYGMCHCAGCCGRSQAHDLHLGGGHGSRQR
jgi:hypothetical protein